MSKLKTYYQYSIYKRHKVVDHEKSTKDRKVFKKTKDGKQMWYTRKHVVTTTDKDSIPKDAFDVRVIGTYPSVSSGKYWERRLKHELDKENRRLLIVTDQALREVYERQAKEVAEHLEDTLFKLLVDSDYGGEILFTDLYRSNTYDEMMKYLNKQAKKLGTTQYKITDQLLMEVLKNSREIIDENFPKDLIGEAQIWNMKKIDDKMLIRSAWAPDKKDFSQRIWKSKSDLVNSIRMVVEDTIIQGRSVSGIAHEIEKRFGVDYSSALRLARTESAHVQIMSQAEKFKEFGYNMCTYRAVDPCDECGELDGNHYTLDEIQQLIPHHPNCECYFTLDLNRGV